MSIARKPTKGKSKPKTDEAAVKAVIEKGGSSVADIKTISGKKNLQLRLETDLIIAIDQLRKKRVVPPSRHSWILEAIHEKRHRETLSE